MTYQEAIECLKKYIGTVTAPNDNFTKAKNMAISALEKQITKKPKLYRRSYWCSVCEGRITSGKKYCGNCGCAIDWSGEN